MTEPRRKKVDTTFCDPVFIDFKRGYGREKRRDIQDYNNMILNQQMIDNELRPERWKGNGFIGHVQYVPYFGRAPIRPGEKLNRDIQMNTFPKEMCREFNRSQMARAKIFHRDFEAERQRNIPHEEYMETMKNVRDTATHREFHEDPFKVTNDIHQRHKDYHDMLDKLSKRVGEFKPAGLASINPTLGTVGATPDLSGGVGPEFNEKWRKITPYGLVQKRDKIYMPWDNDPF